MKVENKQKAYNVKLFCEFFAFTWKRNMLSFIKPTEGSESNENLNYSWNQLSINQIVNKRLIIELSKLYSKKHIIQLEMRKRYELSIFY